MKTIEEIERDIDCLSEADYERVLEWLRELKRSLDQPRRVEESVASPDHGSEPEAVVAVRRDVLGLPASAQRRLVAWIDTLEAELSPALLAAIDVGLRSLETSGYRVFSREELEEKVRQWSGMSHGPIRRTPTLSKE
jgi:hypothetical protein